MSLSPHDRPITVTSTSLAKVAYDSEREQLDVEFHDRSTYRYSGIPQQTYLELMRAPSKGAYFNLNVRNNFPWKIIDSDY